MLIGGNKFSAYYAGHRNRDGGSRHISKYFGCRIWKVGTELEGVG
jgi:hypothetical protein